MTCITVTLDERDAAHANAQAQARGLSLEEWVHELVRREVQRPLRPADPLFGELAGSPELTDAIDEVVAERNSVPLRGE